jgi:hypothetical protein
MEKQMNAFQSGLKDPIVRRLNDAGIDGRFDMMTLVYEAGAEKGDHLCNHFNVAAGVSEDRRNEIDMERRATASARLSPIRQTALAQLSVAEGGYTIGL